MRKPRSPHSYHNKHRCLDCNNAEWTGHWLCQRVAYEGETIAGMCLCNYWVGACHISPLAVRLSWRGKGLGIALLRHSFAEFYRRGTRVVRLGVDTQNPWGAVRLYERVGMRATRLYHQYEKELRPGKELSIASD